MKILQLNFHDKSQIHLIFPIDIEAGKNNTKGKI
jgi:hypothetical protein